jgi:biotin operon repressor
MTQCERIVEYINRYGSITSMEAMMDLGISRLAARISDLRDEGYRIKSEPESGRNRFGEKTHYTRYSLED